jgi:membrane protein YdbS with pleckstrin-like domain
VSLRVYFTLSFALFTVLAILLGINWWLAMDAPWRYFAAVFAAVLAGVGLLYTIAAWFTKYRT